MANVNKEHWRQRLIELIAHVRLNQIEFATRTGIDPSYLSRMLYPPNKQGRKNVGPEQIAKIQTAFELEPGWFDYAMGDKLPAQILPPRSPSSKGSTDRSKAPIQWPFALVPYERFDALLRSLEARDRKAMLDAMDQQLHAIAYLWENTPRAAASKRAAR